MTQAERQRRDRRAIFALLIGVLGAGVTWLAARIQPGEMLCIEQTTLLYVGLGMTGAARLAGEVVGRLPPDLARDVGRLLRRLLERR